MKTLPPSQGPRIVSGNPTPQAITRNLPFFSHQPGQLVKAVVAEVKPNNLYQLQLGEQLLYARSEANLTSGQQLKLQVLQTSPQLEFKIVTDSLNQVIGRSLTIAQDGINPSPLIESLLGNSSVFNQLSLRSQQLLQTFLSLNQNPPSGNNSGQVLKNHLQSLGLGFETLLRHDDPTRAATSLKGALLELMSLIKPNEQPGLLANKLLSMLEFFQLAQLHSDSSQHLIFPLPFSFLEQGYLLIEHDQNSNGGKEFDQQEFRYSLHLKLTELGNLKVVFHHNNKGLLIRFFTETQEKADYLSEFAEQLNPLLGEIHLYGISFGVGAQDPINDLMHHINPQRKTVLNTTA